MARLTTWNEAFDSALAQGWEAEDAVGFADSFFPCPGCGQPHCGAGCAPMADVVDAAVEGRQAA